MAMNASLEATKELIGEHEALMVYMDSLAKSVRDMAVESLPARDKLRNYLYRLYDFKDAVWYHLEVDERIFKSILGNAHLEDPIEEHQEIRKLVHDIITLADNTIIDNLSKEQMNEFCARLGSAFERICKLIALHITRENAILERVQRSLIHQQV
jgi:hypothetical protein